MNTFRENHKTQLDNDLLIIIVTGNFNAMLGAHDIGNKRSMGRYGYSSVPMVVERPQVDCID